jgi:hypothetical protein
VTAGRVWGGRGAGERGEGLAMRHGIVPQIFLNMLAQYAHTHTHTHSAPTTACGQSPVKCENDRYMYIYI